VTSCNSNGALTAGQMIAVVVNDSLIFDEALIEVERSGEGKEFMDPQGWGNLRRRSPTRNSSGKSRIRLLIGGTRLASHVYDRTQRIFLQ